MSLIDYQKISNHLKQGQILAYPTETVWGLGCDLNASESVEKIFDIKGRETTKAMSVLVRDIYQARRLVETSSAIESLFDIFWPGPVTFVLKAKESVPQNVRGNSEFLGLRISSHPFVRDLYQHWSGVLITTSANCSGEKPAQSLDELKWLPQEIIKVPWIEPSESHLASTVIKIDGNQLSLLRQGDTDFSYIQIAAEKVGIKSSSKG